MRILLIGGNGFIGRFVAAELIRQRHAVAIFHRGTRALPEGVEDIRGDRKDLGARGPDLKCFAPDVVIDFVISSGSQAEELMTLFRGAAARLVMLNSIDVYRRGRHIKRHRNRPTAGSSAHRRVGTAPPPASLSTREHATHAQDLSLGDGRLSDKIPAERAVMNDPDNFRGRYYGCPWCMDPAIIYIVSIMS